MGQNNADPDQTAPLEESDQGLHYLSRILIFVPKSPLKIILGLIKIQWQSLSTLLIMRIKVTEGQRSSKLTSHKMPYSTYTIFMHITRVLHLNLLSSASVSKMEDNNLSVNCCYNL